MRDDVPMTTPRRLLVDPDNACDYHLVSHMAAAAVADDPARDLRDLGATGREPDPRGFHPGHTRREQ